MFMGKISIKYRRLDRVVLEWSLNCGFSLKASVSYDLGFIPLNLTAHACVLYTEIRHADDIGK